MKTKWLRVLSLSLCGVLAVGAVAGTAVYADKAGKAADKTDDKLSSLIKKESDADLQKDETVYVLAGADGSVEKIIVSDWIKNAAGSASIRDKSELSDAENVKGDESYTLDGDSMRVWDAKGNDIYYKGSIEKELPVTLSVSYTLDGKPVSAEELAGKSGRVTIRFDYKNNQYRQVSIDGRSERIYVPFAMLTGALLDNDVFTDVEVTNGRLINDGSRTAVIGLAFPGLQEDLAISDDKLSIPDYVEISAKAENFALMNTVTLATNEVFNRIDTSKLDSIDGVSGQLDELTDAMKQLTDGSSALYGGLSTLLDKSGELVSGINKLAIGAEQLKNGSDSLDDGAKELVAGAKKLAAGLAELTEKNDELNGGAKQVFESLLATADAQLAAAGLTVPKLTIDGYDKTLSAVLATLTPESVEAQAEAKVTAEVKKAVGEQVTAAVTAKVRAAVLAKLGMTEESYAAGVQAGLIDEATQKQVEAAVAAEMAKPEIGQQIAQATDAQMQSEAVKQKIAAILASPDTQKQLAAAKAEAKAGSDKLTALKAQLDSYAEFYDGLARYTGGVEQAKTGADQLSAGAGKLQKGAEELTAGMTELYNGILTLKDGAPALVGGVSELKNGAMRLSDGLKEFDEKGVQKLVDAVDGDWDTLIVRIRATADVSAGYKSFSGLSDDMDGRVKFIYRTGEVEAPAKEQ